MYIQITDKCNMKCDHCCFKCEPGKGSNMTMDIFERALANSGGHITIGGGEPTLHPHFETMLIKAIAESENDAPVFIVTNGTNTKLSLLLHKLHKLKVIIAHLSTDIYHDYDMVDNSVREAFGYNDWDCDANGDGPIAIGRWVDEVGNEDMQQCACEDVFVKPNGDVHKCGCLKSPKIGDVVNGFEYSNECYKIEI